MNIRNLSTKLNLRNPAQSFLRPPSTIPTLIFILSTLFQILFNVKQVIGKTVDWSILSSCDTLEVFMKDVPVGRLYSEISIDSSNRIIKVSEKLTISSDASMAGGFTGVAMDEIREFDFNGDQISASQKMKSPGGTALWELKRNKTAQWELTVTVGGMENTRRVENVGGNLNSSYQIQNGINEKNLVAGQEWSDTLFELTAAKNMIITTKCTGIPGKKNPYYDFISHDDLSGMDTRQEMDSYGRIVIQEVPPVFVAKKYVAADKKRENENQKQKKSENLYELVYVPADREQKNNETIALTLKSGVQIPESVRRFYDYKDNKYILKELNKKCHTKNLSERLDNFKDWLSATVTIQSDNSEINDLAMNLKGTKTCRCEISEVFNKYLFTNIEKRHVATFSNAYETLKAGYGDCGEHAVLLAALLRTIGIESNVVLGLVYIPGQKGYYYHAWVVAYIKDLVFVDPALGRFPAAKGYVPLLIDDDGTKIIYLAGLIGKIDISYVPK